MDQTAEVLTKFTGDTKDLDKKTASADKTIKGVAKGLEKAFKVATVAVGATATAIGALVKKSVDAYADFEQLEGGLVSLFGEGSAEMQNILAKSEEAYKNLTMSQNDYLTAFQSAYPLVNAGLSENADSVEYTNKMLQISSDLFNTYGGSVEYYQNAINWALKGSFVYLDNLNLGIKGTQEGFIEAANASGVLGRQIESVNELTSDEIIDVIAHYADAYGVLGRTADEAGGTILGSINMMKASWSNFIAGLSKDGADLDGLIKNVVDSAVNVGNNLLPVITRALESIVKALPTIVQSLAKTLPGTLKTIIPALIQSAIDILNAICFRSILKSYSFTSNLKNLICIVCNLISSRSNFFVCSKLLCSKVEREQRVTTAKCCLLSLIDCSNKRADSISYFLALSLTTQCRVFNTCNSKLKLAIFEVIITSLSDLLKYNFVLIECHYFVPP